MRLRFAALALICASGLLAQVEAPLFPKASYFRKMWSNPSTQVQLEPPAKLADYAVDGKLELSLRAYLDLVMANNTDISITKLSVENSRNAITNAFGQYDPRLTVTAGYNHSAIPASTQLDGANVNKQTQFGPVNFTYNQLLENGTSFNLGFNGSKSSSNSAFSTYNPAFVSNFSAGFTQPLLRGRSPAIVRMPITIARANLRTTELNIRSQVMTAVQNAESAYWAVIGARESLRVQQESLAMRKQSLERSQRELELGAIPQLETYQPEADYQNAVIQVTQAKFRLAQLEDALRRQIGADLDPKYRELPIVLTETVMPPSEATPLDRESLVQKALANRPEMQSSRIGLDIDDLNIRSAADQLRPQLNLTGSYRSNGRGGNQYVRTGLGSGQITTMIPGGLYDALSEVFGFNNTTYSLGLTLNLPLRDRAGQARLANSLLSKKQDTLSLRSREQSVRLEVLNAITNLESSRESVKLAIIARDLAQKQLDADRQRYDLGVIQMYFVLDSQTRLTTAEARVVTESINYRTNQLNLLRVTGTLLDERGIAIQY
ncbi:MAG: TolC family protein [Bryobacterales bacterium]|nr:TolC family protein [Bryobacterales bacterium]